VKVKVAVATGLVVTLWVPLKYIHKVRYCIPAASRCVDDRGIDVVDSDVLLTIAESDEKQNEEFQGEHGLTLFLRHG